MAQVVLKATFGEETHRVSLGAPLAFAAVRSAIAGFFPQLAAFRITYKDEDGDCITVATDTDITEAIRFFGKNPLKFAIVADGKVVSDAKAEPEPVKAPTPAPTPVEAAPAAVPAKPVFNSLVNASRTAPEPVLPAVTSRLEARFVRDVSVPDGSVFAPDAKFKKTWCMKNTGTFAWPAGCVLRFEAGDQLGGVAAPVPVVQAGCEVELSVDFACPVNKEGKFVSYWRLCNAEGLVFGDRIWTEIKVEKGAAAAAAPAPTPAPAVVIPGVAVTAQPPLAPLPTPPTPVQFAFAFQPALDQVKGMGFPDNEKTRRLLVKNRGDVPRTLQDLLEP